MNHISIDKPNNSSYNINCIGGVMVSVLECGRQWVHRWCNG